RAIPLKSGAKTGCALAAQFLSHLPHQPAEMSATDASAPTIPRACGFEIRSFNNTRARITVLAGYSDESTVAASSLPCRVAAMNSALPAESSNPESTMGQSTVRKGCESRGETATSASISTVETDRAATSGQKTP